MKGILVASNYERIVSFIFGAACDRADDIVSLELFDLEVRDVHRGKDILHDGYLHGKFRRHLAPSGFVVSVFVMPERRCLAVPRDGYIFRVVVVEDLQQHVEESVNALSVHAVLGYHRALHGVIRSVYEAVPVYDDNHCVHISSPEIS